MWKRGQFLLFSTIFLIYLNFNSPITYKFIKCVTGITKYFKESLGIRDNDREQEISNQYKVSYMYSWSKPAYTVENLNKHSAL